MAAHCKISRLDARSRNLISQTEKWISSLIGIWLISGYVLPNTAWETASVRPIVSFVRYQCSNFSACLLVYSMVACAAILWISYSRICTTVASRSLWTALLMIVGAYSFNSLAHPNGSTSSYCVMVLLSFLMGLLSARLLGLENGITALCLLSCVQCVYMTHMYYYRSDSFMSGSLLRAGGTFKQPIEVYTFFLVCIPLLKGLYECSSARWIKIGLACIGGLMGSCLLITWNRGAFLALTVSVTWLFWRINTNRKVVLALALTLILIFSAVVAVRSWGPANRRSADISAFARLVIWKHAWNMFVNNAETGVGPSHVTFAVQSKRAGAFHEDTLRQPLNSVLYWLDEFGVLGGVLFGAMAVSTIKIFRSTTAPIALGIAAAWMGLFIAGLTDTTLALTFRKSENALIGMLLGFTVLSEQMNQGRLRCHAGHKGQAEKFLLSAGANATPSQEHICPVEQSIDVSILS